MASTEAALSLPWYRSLSGPQWKTLVAANLSWTLDSFEFFALFITVGFALHQLVAPAEHAAIPRYAGYVLAATLFGWGRRRDAWRDHRGLYRPQAHDGADNTRLFSDHRIERAVLELGIVSGAALYCWCSDRLRMEHRSFDCRGAMA
jgi:hypothetical protein